MHSVSRYVDSPEFHQSDADRLIVSLPSLQVEDMPKGADNFDKLFAARPFAVAVQSDLFRMMNYLKFRASTGLPGAMQEALRVRSLLIVSSQRIIPYSGGKMLRRLKRRRPDVYADIVLTATERLIHCVDHFDCGTGFRFSTYAVASIWGSMAGRWKTVSQWLARNQQFEEFEDGTEASGYVESKELDPLDAAGRAESAAKVTKLLRCLSGRHRELIESLFGINGAVPQSAEQIAESMNITRSRVGQLKESALQRLRSAVEKKAAM